MADDGGASRDPTWFDEALNWPGRPGLWRRLAALSIDYIVVFVIFFPLTSLAHYLTDGGVKSTFSLRWNLCQAATLNHSSDPSLSRYSWNVCRTSIFGLKIAELAVGTAPDQQAGEPSSISLDLDSKGNFRPAALDLGFLEPLVLALYFFVLERKSGQSIGKRSMAIKVHDQYDKHRTGLSVQTSARRQTMKFLGFAPMALLGGWYALQAWGDVPGHFQQISNLEIVIALVVSAIALVWPIWIMISTALGDDPIHDRVASTTVRLFEIET